MITKLQLINIILLLCEEEGETEEEDDKEKGVKQKREIKESNKKGRKNKN